MVKNCWNELPRMVPERGYHGLATINGEMFVVGGITTTRVEGRENTTEMLETGIRTFLSIKKNFIVWLNPIVNIVISKN